MTEKSAGRATGIDEPSTGRRAFIGFPREGTGPGARDLTACDDAARQRNLRFERGLWPDPGAWRLYPGSGLVRKPGVARPNAAPGEEADGERKVNRPVSGLTRDPGRRGRSARPRSPASSPADENPEWARVPCRCSSSRDRQPWAVAVAPDRAMFAWATPGGFCPPEDPLDRASSRRNGGRGAATRERPGATTSPAAPLPADHPPLRPQRIGVLLLNLGTPDGTDYWSMRRYLKEFLSDERVIDVNPLIWKPLLNLVILTTRPVAQRQGLRGDLEPGAGRIAAAHHHPRAMRRARRSARRRLARPRPPGRLGDALRQSVDARGGAQDGRGGLHPAAPVRPLSAVRRGDHRDRLRSGVPGAARGALAAGGAHRAALLRAPLVHRGARPLDRGPPRRARPGGRRSCSRRSTACPSAT